MHKIIRGQISTLVVLLLTSVGVPYGLAGQQQVSAPIVVPAHEQPARQVPAETAESSLPLGLVNENQDAANANRQAAQQDDLIINLADKANLDLPSLVRWLAEVRKMKILDDSQLSSNTNRVKFYGKSSVSTNAMFELVQGVLRSNNLALVMSDVEGWHRIVPLAEVRPFAPQGDPKDFGNAEYVTAVFTLEYITPEEADAYLRQLIYTGPGQSASASSITTIPARNTVIVTDTAKKLRAIAQLIEQVDVPKEETETRFYTVKHLDATELEQQLQSLLEQSGSLPQNQGNSPTARSGQPNAIPLKIAADIRTNRLILIGSSRQIDQVMILIQQLDVDLGFNLVRYQFQYISAAQIDQLVRQSLGGLDENAIKRVYQSTVNEQTNQLIVTSNEEIHKRIGKLKQELDVPSSRSQTQSPVRFYTLKNVKVIDILDTLQSIVQRIGNDPNGQLVNGQPLLTGINTRAGFEVPGGNNLPLNLEGPLTPPPFLQDSTARGERDPFLQSDRASAIGRFDESLGYGPSVVGDIARLVADFEQPVNVIPGNARITVDENSNTLIVVAEPDVQQLYADLIERLDRRRPQVLIEAHVVIINANDNCAFGVEIAGGDRQGVKRLFAFTSYGLSEVDAATGVLSIIPGIGFNGTLVDPETADLVIRALATHERARVAAAPRILVNDNATGLLSSVAEFPFASINAANTVSTTSFAGFAQAGTTISVTPQISDDNYLNLEFDILLNDFTGSATEGLPPPRNTDQVTSVVSIPDGHTVIVGGLTRRRSAVKVEGLPIIERIPILRRLTSLEGRTREDQRLFVFIKPIILRDDKFRDLRFLSELERRNACIPNDYPASEPVLIK